MADNRKRIVLLTLVSVVVLSLGACREEEQGRLLNFEPGVFLGKNPDKNLSESQRADLRSRTDYQSGSTSPVGGASKSRSSSTAQAKLMQTLRLRARSQSGSQ